LLRNLLSQQLSKSLVLELQNLYWQDHAEKPMAEIPDAALFDVASHLSDWQLKPSGTEGYRTAEVTLCGVNTDHLSSKTMECKTQPGLFFVGEVMDVTGHLGGYNFQWAWASGYAAGQSV
jgi:predicted flavoprotein YhiN